ncbi:RidA family protein [Nonomuraea sp. NPDC049784]|uniref:RidA family protein n=1 Tax=Nonomuraea sp. NPDC049784 TaxID=3154361 RepID=UPI0033F0D066
MSFAPDSRLARTVAAASAFGLAWPQPAPTHEFLAVKKIGWLVCVSGHAPFDDERFQYQGQVGADIDLMTAQQAARMAVLGCLVSLDRALGDLEAVQEIVKVNGYVHCIPGFEPLPAITDAASRLLIEVFGDDGRHARTTVGVASLPFGVAVELEIIALARMQAKPRPP